MSTFLKKYLYNPWLISIGGSIIGTIIIGIVLGFLTGLTPNYIFIFIFVTIISFCAHFVLKREESAIITKEGKSRKIWKYPHRWRRLGFLGIGVVCFVFLMCYIGIVQEIYYYIRIPATSEDKIGIWVAKITNQKEGSTNQHALIEKINFFLTKEMDLRKLVEVRALPFAIEGKTLEEKESRALKLGDIYNASLLIWGTITTELGYMDEFLMVTLSKVHKFSYQTLEGPMLIETPYDASWPAGQIRTIPLEIVTIETRRREQRTLSLPVQHIKLPPRVGKPIENARVIVGLSFLQSNKCEKAKEYFKKFLEKGEPTGLFDVPDVHFYIGDSHFCSYLKNRELSELEKAIDYFDKASDKYSKHELWGKYSIAEFNSGSAFLMLARSDVKPSDNSEHAILHFQKAIGHMKEDIPAPVYINLASAHLIKAAYGSTPKVELQSARDALYEASRIIERKQDPLQYAGVITLLGLTYYSIAGQGEDIVENLAKVYYEERSKIANDQK